MNRFFRALSRSKVTTRYSLTKAGTLFASSVFHRIVAQDNCLGVLDCGCRVNLQSIDRRRRKRERKPQKETQNVPYSTSQGTESGPILPSASIGGIAAPAGGARRHVSRGATEQKLVCQQFSFTPPVAAPVFATT
jgi:hypothetical protein